MYVFWLVFTVNLTQYKVNKEERASNEKCLPPEWPMAMSVSRCFVDVGYRRVLPTVDRIIPRRLGLSCIRKLA